MLSSAATTKDPDTVLALFVGLDDETNPEPLASKTKALA